MKPRIFCLSRRPLRPANATKTYIKNFLAEKGLTLTEWAMSQGIPPQAVTDLMNGRTKATRGMAHKAAVALGMKRAA